MMIKFIYIYVYFILQNLHCPIYSTKFLRFPDNATPFQVFIKILAPGHFVPDPVQAVKELGPLFTHAVDHQGAMWKPAAVQGDIFLGVHGVHAHLLVLACRSVSNTVKF